MSKKLIQLKNINGDNLDPVNLNYENRITTLENLQDIEDITSKITKTANVGTTYLYQGYRKGNKCYFDVQFDINSASATSTIFTLDNSLKPKKDALGIATNYSASSSISGFARITTNSTNLIINIYGTILPYVVLHIEWEIY